MHSNDITTTSDMSPQFNALDETEIEHQLVVNTDIFQLNTCKI